MKYKANCGGTTSVETQTNNQDSKATKGHDILLVGNVQRKSAIYVQGFLSPPPPRTRFPMCFNQNSQAWIQRVVSYHAAEDKTDVTDYAEDNLASMIIVISFCDVETEKEFTVRTTAHCKMTFIGSYQHHFVVTDIVL